MFWRCISYKGAINLVEIQETTDSEYYVVVLQNSLIPIVDVLHGDNWIFQQYNAAVHTTNVTNWFLEANNIELMDWPTKSPDSKILKNVWGVLAHRVYAGGRQLCCVTYLQNAIMDE